MKILNTDPQNKKTVDPKEAVMRSYNDDCQKKSRFKCILPLSKCSWLLTKENKKGSGCFGQDYFNKNIDNIKEKYVKAPLILKNCESINYNKKKCEEAINCYWDDSETINTMKSPCRSK